MLKCNMGLRPHDASHCAPVAMPVRSHPGGSAYYRSHCATNGRTWARRSTHDDRYNALIQHAITWLAQDCVLPGQRQCHRRAMAVQCTLTSWLKLPAPLSWTRRMAEPRLYSCIGGKVHQLQFGKMYVAADFLTHRYRCHAPIFTWQPSAQVRVVGAGGPGADRRSPARHGKAASRTVKLLGTAGTVHHPMPRRAGREGAAGECQ
jgi:hypothetical protein